jgi:small subunit ribosomal protein S18
MLRKYMSDRGKIRSRRVTGNCAQHQRALAQAIKTARELVLLPYTQRTVTERPGGRRGDRERPLSDTPPPAPVSVEVIDETDNLGDSETELSERAEVEELVEELVEDAVADEAEAEAPAGAGGGDEG